MRLRHIILVPAVFLLGYCKDPEPPAPENSFSVSAQETELVPLQVATLKSDKKDFAETTLTGSIAGQSINIAIDNNSGVLSFLTPDLPAGAALLNFSAGGKNFSFNYTIKASPIISDPLAVINSAISDVTLSNTELDKLNTELGTMGNDKRTQNINLIKELKSEVETMLAGLSEAEKLELAKFMKANPELFTVESDPLVLMDSFVLKKTDNYPEATMNELFQRIEVDKKVLVKISAIAIGGLLVGQPVISAVAVLAGITKICMMNERNVITLGKAWVQFKELIIDEMKLSKKADYTFSNGNSYTFKIKSEYRALNNTDLSSGSSSIQNISAFLYEVRTGWNNANKLVKMVGKTLDGVPFHFKDVSSVKSKVYSVNPKFLGISENHPQVLSNAKILSSGNEVQFTSTTGSDVYFEFEIVYTYDNVGEKRLKANGNLIMDQPVSVVTTEATNELSFSANVGGDITNNASINIIDKGVCYTEGVMPTVDDSKVSAGAGSNDYTVLLQGLKNNTEYEARAYIVTSSGVKYGQPVIVKTENEPDSTLFFKYACVGTWNVYNAETDESAIMVLKNDNTGTYKFVDKDSIYNITWSLSKTQNSLGKTEYKLNDPGFWHYKYDSYYRTPLKNPVNSFTVQTSAGAGASIQYNKQ